MEDGGGTNAEKVDKTYEGFKEGVLKGVPEITVHELHDMIEKGKVEGSEGGGNQNFIVVDARLPEEMDVSMLPGALTKAEFEGERDKWRDKDVVAYCTIGYRSGKYIAELRKQGFEHARNLRGSILSWANAGLPLQTRDGKPTHRVHTFGEKWALVDEPYSAEWFRKTPWYGLIWGSIKDNVNKFFR